MSKFNKLCPGCFTANESDGACPSCGYDMGAYRSPLALHDHAFLNDQYLVGRVLGKPGGFGITYFGWDTRLETAIAIKEYLPREFVGRGKDGTTVTPHSEEDSKTFEQGLQEFLQEARTLARFDHSNLVRVRNFFEQNDTAYLVMDYLEGCNLEEHRKKADGKLPEKEAIGIMIQVLDGLTHVHVDNLLHRDIKPQNIYLTKDGRAILLDFGAARVAMSGFTRSMSVILTPGFAPYEQYSRRGLQGPWTDVYACAATLYYIITGKVLPDSADEANDAAFSALDSDGKDLSLSLHQALRPALAVLPENRTQTASDFKTALERARNLVASDDIKTVVMHTPQPAAATAPPARKKAPVTRYAVLLLIIIAAATYFFVPRSAQPPQSATTIPKEEGGQQLATKEAASAGAVLDQPGQPKKGQTGEADEADMFANHLSEGDRLFAAKSFAYAKNEYVKALALNPEDDHAKDRLQKCDDEIESARTLAKREAAYAKYRKQADGFFKKGNLAKAKTGYANALKSKPGDIFAARRLQQCDEMVFIKGSAFLMGTRESKDEPVHMVILGSFLMDKHEVTVKQYSEFLKAKKYDVPPEWQKQLTRPNHPVAYVSWDDANAYAKWADKRLPTEAEWEYAARGGLENKRYPWGDEPPESRPEQARRFGAENQKSLRQVNLYSANGFGLFDMADNAWEWCSDWFQFDYYKNSPDRNPRGPKTGSRRVVRGIIASSGFAAYNFKCSTRFAQEPNQKKRFIGFRCARDLP